MDDLVDKTDHLSVSSKAFYKEVRREREGSGGEEEREGTLVGRGGEGERGAGREPCN